MVRTKVSRVAPIYKEGPTEDRSNSDIYPCSRLCHIFLERQSSTNLMPTSKIISCFSHNSPASGPYTQF